MKSVTILLFAGIVAATLSLSASAQPITGNLGFGGAITVNSTQASSSTMESAGGFSPYTVTGPVGSSFAAAGVADGSTVTFTSSAWNFNDTATITNFWAVGGFTFTLLNSAIDPHGTGGSAGHSAMEVDINGTISGNGHTATPFDGIITFQDPSVPTTGTETYAASLSFAPAPVPEPGTMALLGAALPALVLVRRKFRG